MLSLKGHTGNHYWEISECLNHAKPAWYVVCSCGLKSQCCQNKLSIRHLATRHALKNIGD
jgi:hypothetical protein